MLLHSTFVFHRVHCFITFINWLTSLSHGRDSTLKVWQLRTTDEPSLSTSLPIDDTAISRQAPWLLHSLAVNTLNFCTFAMCTAPKSPPATGFEAKDDTGSEGDGENGILVAVPGINDKGADLFHLPSEKRRYVVAPISSTDTGNTDHPHLL